VITLADQYARMSDKDGYLARVEAALHTAAEQLFGAAPNSDSGKQALRMQLIHNIEQGVNIPATVNAFGWYCVGQADRVNDDNATDGLTDDYLKATCSNPVVFDPKAQQLLGVV
jgi:hypothetical protein